MKNLSYQDKKMEIQERFLGGVSFSDFESSEKVWEALKDLEKHQGWELKYSNDEEIEFNEIDLFFDDHN